jgi:hypothetical protein
MWTAESGEIEENGMECPLEKQVGVELRPKREKSGGLRLFVLMTRFGAI